MPLKRHPVLQDLSRDHQRFLIEARHMRWIAVGDPRAMGLTEFLDLFEIFWDQHGRMHFYEEELVLLPSCFDEGDLDYERVLSDHEWLKHYINEMFIYGESTPLHAFGELSNEITAHIRYEERELFERIQSQLNEDELANLGERLLDFRKKNRPPDAIGPYRGGNSDDDS